MAMAVDKGLLDGKEVVQFGMSTSTSHPIPCKQGNGSTTWKNFSIIVRDLPGRMMSYWIDFLKNP
jgi:hypothetical protein